MSERLLRLPSVLDRVPYGRSRLYEKVRDGSFPAPIKIGDRAVAWKESDIDAWIDARIRESDAQAQRA